MNTQLFSLDNDPRSTRSPADAAPRGRASWSGLLRVSLVALPVKAYPAINASDSICFNQLHADCGQRVRYEKHCPAHGKLDAGAIVKGYQYAPDQYVVVESSELQQLRPARDKALTLEQFVEPGQVDLALFSGRSLYLLPDKRPARRPYLVLAETMKQQGCWAIGQVVMSARRQLAVVRPSGCLLVMHLLHDPAQWRAASGWEAELTGRETASDEERKLATMLIESATGPLDWSRYRDDTAEMLSELIEAKIAGRQLITPDDEPLQVLELLDALLKQSVEQADQRKNSKASKQKKKTTRRRTA